MSKRGVSEALKARQRFEMVRSIAALMKSVEGRDSATECLLATYDSIKDSCSELIADEKNDFDLFCAALEELGKCAAASKADDAIVVKANEVIRNCCIVAVMGIDCARHVVEERYALEYALRTVGSYNSTDGKDLYKDKVQRAVDYFRGLKISDRAAIADAIEDPNPTVSIPN